jgi:hypothetical protein
MQPNELGHLVSYMSTYEERKAHIKGSHRKLWDDGACSVFLAKLEVEVAFQRDRIQNRFGG